jgi:hypothetical protein
MATSSRGRGREDAEARPAAETTTAEATMAENKRSDASTTAAVVGVVALGALVFESALIPGMALGVAAMLVPKVLPTLGEDIQSAFRATVRGAYNVGRRARHAFGEARTDSATTQL